METLNITAKELLDGKVVTLETIDKEDLREAELSCNPLSDEFIIWFNGKLIHSSKTFKSMLNRLNKLDNKFPLESPSHEN